MSLITENINNNNIRMRTYTNTYTLARRYYPIIVFIHHMTKLMAGHWLLPLITENVNACKAWQGRAGQGSGVA